MEGGQPGNTNALKYKDAKTLEEGINKYFEDCDKDDRPYTITGLANALGIDRDTLKNYSNRESFSALVKNAKLRVEQQIEERALSGKHNATFSIFNLKVNYKWDDGQESNKETPVVNINVVDNSKLEKAMYEEDKSNENDD